MSELDRAYGALAHAADTVRLATPDALRARADRRSRLRVTAVVVAAAVAVGGGLVGSQWVLRADGAAPIPGSTATVTPPPPTTASPPTTAPPTSAPATTPHTTGSAEPTGRPAPKNIPNSAFLQVADTNGEEPVVDAEDEDVLPGLCDARFASDDDFDLRRTRRITYWKAPARVGYVPDGTFRQTITVYQPDGASRFLDELRGAVEACPEDGDRAYRMLSAPRHGDESLVFEERYPTVDVEGQPTGGYDVRIVSAVRIGEIVTILYETGWEDGWSAEPAVVNAFTGKAVSRLRSWLD